MGIFKSKPQVLIVDDEEALLDILNYELTDQNYEVHKAKSGKTAIEILQKTKIDLIISDVRMPEGDGIFLIKYVKQTATPPIPFIFISGHSDIPLKEAYELGAEAVFNKPTEYEALSALVAIIFRQKQIEGNNLRKHIRLDYDFKAQIMIPLQGKETIIQTTIKNISEDGFFFFLPDGELPQIDQEIHFEIFPPQNRIGKISGEGRCRWIRYESKGPEFPRGFGLKTNKLTPATYHNIYLLLNDLKTNLGD